MFEGFNQPIDLYCERLSTAFWAEPVNAISNLAFILGAVFAYMLYRRSGLKSGGILGLIIMSAIVGAGSFIFHTIATKGAMLADVIPIGIFIIYALILTFIEVFHLKWYHAIIGVVAFLVFNALIFNAFGMHILNGSIQYIPTFIMLMLVSLYAGKKRYIGASQFGIAAMVFLISLICRSVDRNICPHFPIGSHFLWHVLNSIAMYYVMDAIIRATAGRTNSRP